MSFIAKKVELRQDSMSHVFFIPTKENLKSELTFYHELLSQLKNFSPVKEDSIRYDSLNLVLQNKIDKTKGWTSGLNNYDLQEIIEEQFSKDVFLQKKYLEQVPLFYKKGKVVLKKESLEELDFYIKKQIQVYWFLKKEFSENEPAQMAVKDFIGFLNSIKVERKISKR